MVVERNRHRATWALTATRTARVVIACPYWVSWPLLRHRPPSSIAPAHGGQEPTIEDPFSSSKYSLERAKGHIGDLERQISAFLGTDPYTRVMEHNADRTEDIYKLKLAKPMPRALPGIASDAITNLRASLDQAGYAVAIATGKNGKRAHFPFGLTLREVERRATGKGPSIDLPKEVFDLMVSFKPYKGGNNLLWALNELCNSQKHELIVPVAIYIGPTAAINHTYLAQPTEFQFPPVWDRAKHEMVLARVRHGTAIYYDCTIQFLVAIGKVDVVEGQPAVAVLNQLAGTVERIVMALEAESRRLGLIT